MPLNLYKIRPSYIFRPRGKNLKFVYFIRCGLRSLVPAACPEKTKRRLLDGLDARPDLEQILERVRYCNRLSAPYDAQAITTTVGDVVNGRNVYYRDTFEISRFFDKSLKLGTAFGDNTRVPGVPSVCKSRPISADNANCVLLNMDKVRHFIFLRDRRSFADKKDAAIFRGATYQENRRRFMEMFYGNPLVDCGDTRKKEDVDPPQWHRELITLYDHLRYKFVVSLEGNDVASNLKWVMSSNSVAVMPRPRYETWFMEGRLVPGVHYIEVAPDYSDLEDKLRYYIGHPREAEAIAANANAWCRQFMDPQRELLVSLLVLDKYFSLAADQDYRPLRRWTPS